MERSRARQYRRIAQACENCRRKKIRCPGQKPRCSSCTRLGQQCAYANDDPDGENDSSETQAQLSQRLNQLEQKLDRIIGGANPSSPPEATMLGVAHGLSHQHASILGSSPTGPSLSFPPARVSEEVMSISLEIFFDKIHCQPLWLIDRDHSLSPDMSDELVSVVVALALTSSPHRFTDYQVPSPDFYSRLARRGAMLKIADGIVGIQAAQALCLLAFLDIITGSFRSAGLTMGLAKNAFRCSILGSPSSTNSNEAAEHSKLFWSLSLLDLHYGPPILIPSISEGVHSPRFATIEAKLTSLPCVPLPQESESSGVQYLPNVWSNSIRIGTLWADARSYVSKCVQGLNELPWRPNSDYTKLCSQLLDFEGTHPTSLTYNVVKFAERDAEEIREHRDQWLPWLRGQMTYHAIHCVLNHPFLYSIRVFQRAKGTNTFWRSSSEKALRHCTWISRLIRLARDKGLESNDPFLVQAAGIAGSLHLYWTHTSDSQLRDAALTNLGICQEFIAEMAAHWPVSKVTQQGLEKLMNSVSTSDGPEAGRAPTISATRSLIWSILDVTGPQFSINSGDRQQQRTSSDAEYEENEYITVNDDERSSSPTNMRESTAHYASPPAWAAAGNQRNEAHSEGEDNEHGHAYDVHPGDRIENVVDFDLSWGALEHMMIPGEGSTPLNWWECDDL